MRWNYYKLRQLIVYYKVRWTVITNCDSSFITNYDMVNYKLRQVLQSAMDLLQIATGITKCDDYYKLRQYSGSMIFLGGGALVSCSTSTPINHNFFCRIPVVLEENRRSSQGEGGGGSHPLHPPRRSAPAIGVMKFLVLGSLYLLARKILLLRISS